MTRAAGDGPGRRGPAGTAIINHAELAALDAPGQLARALAVTGLDVPAATRLLRDYGCPVSITAGRNDLAIDGDGLWAPHPVNITAAGWSYSAAAHKGHDKCCAPRVRGVYQGQRWAGRLPYEHARVMVPEGRVPLACYLLSVAPGGPRVIVTYDDIDRGRWAHRLGMALSRDRTIRDAVVTVLLELVNSPDLAERPHALTPSTRTPDGRCVPVPEWSTLPPGYGDQPATPDADRLAHRGALADVAGRCPQVALLLGASAGAPLAAATRVQSCGWELVAAPRTGKTTTMQAIAAVWGNPSLPPDPGIMMSWDATSRGMGRLAGMLGTIPFIADETGTADFDPAEWSRFQYGMAQGGARTLATQSGEGMKRTGGWAGCWFTSGNGSIAENRSGKFAGIAARVITLTGPFTTSAGQACQLRDATAGDYGYLGPAVLEAVDVDQFRGWHAAARESIGAPEGGVLGTTGDQLAAAVAGAMGLDLVLGTGNRLAAAAARAARDYLAVTAEPEPDRDRLLRALAECLSSNRPAWPDRDAYEALGQAGSEPGAATLARHGYTAQLDGCRDDEWLYVYRAAWDRLIAEQGVAATLVLRELYDRGDLAVPDANRAKGEWTAHAPRWARRVSVYKVRLSALGTTSGDDDGQDPGPGQSPAREFSADIDSRAPDGGDPWAAEAAAMDAYRQAELPAPAAAEPIEKRRGDPQHGKRRRGAGPRPAAWLAAARNRRPFTSDDQWAEFERRAVLLDAPDIGDHPERLAILDALEGKGRTRTTAAGSSPGRSHPCGRQAAPVLPAVGPRRDTPGRRNRASRLRVGMGTGLLWPGRRARPLRRMDSRAVVRDVRAWRADPDRTVGRDRPTSAGLLPRHRLPVARARHAGTVGPVKPRWIAGVGSGADDGTAAGAGRGGPLAGRRGGRLVDRRTVQAHRVGAPDCGAAAVRDRDARPRQ